MNLTDQEVAEIREMIEKAEMRELTVEGPRVGVVAVVCGYR